MGVINYSSSLDTYLIGVWLGEIGDQTPDMHMLIRDWITFSNFTSFSTLSSEHNGEDTCNHLRDEQHMHFQHPQLYHERFDFNQTFANTLS